MELNASGRPELRIGLQNHAENVALVRQALNGVGAAVQLDAPVLADVKTAVSEACNNVVVHAYSGGPGPMEVYMAPDEHELEVVVSDRGAGIRPGTPASPNGMQGVGLSLIQALTKTVEFAGGVDEGTEVRMVFDAGEPLKVGGAESVQADADAPGGPPRGTSSCRCAGCSPGRCSAAWWRWWPPARGSRSNACPTPRSWPTPWRRTARPSFSGRHLHLAIDTDDQRLRMRLGPLDGRRRQLAGVRVRGGRAGPADRAPHRRTVRSTPSTTARRW